ncbi:MAG: DUF4062 domain-containing protein [Cytophagaceae bacterium]|nr:DUF4062 domain-containing protein [Cytophagaceae bacterium]
MSKYKVYLSSTFRDLEKHRAEVIKFFGIVGERFELKNMEMYAPDGQMAVEACLNDVADCDIYLLLIGRRCGWIPGENPADPVSIQGDGKISITHLEFDQAVATNRTILVFLCNPNDTDLPQDPGDALFEEKQTKLNILRGEANQYKHHAAFFTSEDNLARQVAEAMILTKKDILTPQEKSRLITVYHTYCYDRKEQTINYREKAINLTPFKVFVIHGEDCELGESLIYRLGYFNLNFELEKFSIPMNEVLSGNTIYQNIRKKFLFEIYDRVRPGQAEKEPDLSPESLLKFLAACHYKQFALYTKITNLYWKNGTAPVVKQLIAEFMAASRTAEPIQLTWFVLLENIPENTIQENNLCVLAPAADAPCTYCPR